MACPFIDENSLSCTAKSTIIMALKDCFISSDTHCWVYRNGIQLAKIKPSRGYVKLLVEENSLLSFVSCKYGWAVFHEMWFPKLNPHSMDPYGLDVCLLKEEELFGTELSVDEKDRKTAIWDYQSIQYSPGRRRLIGWPHRDWEYWEYGVSYDTIVIDDRCSVICSGAFSNCRDLKHISIPEGVMGIGDYAFSGCGLEEVHLPCSLRYIGDGAFAGCELKSISIPDKVCVIGKYVFEACRELEDVVFHSSYLDEIPENTFSRCTSLKSIRLPDNTALIGEDAFVLTHSLKTIELPPRLKCLGPGAFRESGLKEITLPSSLESIGTACFSRGTHLRAEIGNGDSVALDYIRRHNQLYL